MSRQSCPCSMKVGRARAPRPSAMLTRRTVHICGSGRSCLAKIASILESPRSNAPTIVIIDVPYDEEQRLKRMSREPRTPSPTSSRLMRINTSEPDDIYGTHLLTHVSAEISSRNFSKLVVPVVMLTGLEREVAPSGLPSPGIHGAQVLTDTVRLSRYLDAGAFDVFSSPLTKDRMHGLVIHAYRLHKEFAREEASFLTKRNRKLSWVGVDDAKPYGYLREAMVSNLMTGICNPETVGESLESRYVHLLNTNLVFHANENSEFDLSQDRRTVVEDAVGTWAFSAHDYTDDELLYAALVMLKHALHMPELDKWSIPEGKFKIHIQHCVLTIPKTSSLSSCWLAALLTTSLSSTTTFDTLSMSSKPSSTSSFGSGPYRHIQPWIPLESRFPNRP
jgi:hypothetical protein